MNGLPLDNLLILTDLSEFLSLLHQSSLPVGDLEVNVFDPIPSARGRLGNLIYVLLWSDLLYFGVDIQLLSINRDVY